MANWRLRQENDSQSFPYVFPQMPPRFRRCCAFMRALLLLERCSAVLLVLGGLAWTVLLVVYGRAGLNAFLDSGLEANPFFVLCLAEVIAALPVMFLCRLFRQTPKWFWRCPCCGRLFPYYRPPMRGMDELAGADCLYEMQYLGIPYVKPKYCPLVAPSVCPKCGRKFFETT